MEKNFCSNNFNNFCKTQGIVHLLSVPYTPQQNGRIERLNGVLISSATAMLSDAKLSKRFWQDAVSTASYIYNRLPHKPIMNKIPYELLYKKQATYDNFRVFGCKVFFYLPKNFQHKFEDSGLPGIFIGYCRNPKAYKIFDVTNNKVVISRTVDFFEKQPADFYFDKTIKDVNTSDDQPSNIEENYNKNNNAQNPTNPINVNKHYF